MAREDRERRARHTIQRAIPEMLRASPRAKHGISQADLIVDPQPVVKTPTGPATPITRPDLIIRVANTDTLQAASRLSGRPFATKRTTESRRAEDGRSTVTVHNMASLSRPGGGFRSGSNGQEEFLCHRTTLHASLFDDFYALPEIGGVFTPDVLVFRDTNAIDLPKRDRYFVNVITAGLPKHPENRGRYDEREVSCSCGVSYCDRDRDIVVRKMKAVLRMAQMKGTKQLILGAWGCGTLHHPVKEVAKLWRKVIAGSPRQRRPNSEQWEGIDEVVFAIPDSRHAKEFRRVFDDVLADDVPVADSGSSTRNGAEADSDVERLINLATSLELQIEKAQGSFLKARLKDDLRGVNEEIALGRAAKASRDSDDTADDEDVEDDYVVSGFVGSDGEENSFYHLDGTTSDSESDGARSEIYEFRFGGNPAGGDSSASQDEDEIEDSVNYSGYPSGPEFDQNGWFRGSIDELWSARSNGRKKESVSPKSPVVRPLDDDPESTAVDGFLARFQRSDVDDQS